MLGTQTTTQKNKNAEVKDAIDPRYTAYLAQQFKGIYSPAELEELIASSQFLIENGPATCHAKDDGGMEEWAKRELRNQTAASSCGWYHSTWQVLRLLNMVAVPRWYPFYNHALSSVLRVNPRANVLISAAADYGMLATLHDAVQLTGATPRITLYDICGTPLRSTEWFAKRHQIEVKYVRGNILETDMPEAPFDLIVTDEFLSVLKDEWKWLATAAWKKLLAPGGTVVTTAMVGTPTTPELRASFASRSKELFTKHRGLVFPYVKDADAAAMLQRLQTFADFHTRHMLKGPQDIAPLFKDFSALSYEVTRTPGECVNPTDSYQIVAVR
jgi:hypothetical protein